MPNPDVSLVDLTCVVSKPTTVDAVNDAFRKAAKGPMQGVLAVSDAPLVSHDYIGDPHSSTVDAMSTQVIDGTLWHVSSWYDNEMGYATRCVDLLELVAAKLGHVRPAAAAASAPPAGVVGGGWNEQEAPHGAGQAAPRGPAGRGARGLHRAAHGRRRPR